MEEALDFAIDATLQDLFQSMHRMESLLLPTGVGTDSDTDSDTDSYAPSAPDHVPDDPSAPDDPSFDVWSAEEEYTASDDDSTSTVELNTPTIEQAILSVATRVGTLTSPSHTLSSFTQCATTFRDAVVDLAHILEAVIDYASRADVAPNTPILAHRSSTDRPRKVDIADAADSLMTAARLILASGHTHATSPTPEHHSALTAAADALATHVLPHIRSILLSTIA